MKKLMTLLLFLVAYHFSFPLMAQASPNVSISYHYKKPVNQYNYSINQYNYGLLASSDFPEIHNKDDFSTVIHSLMADRKETATLHVKAQDFVYTDINQLLKEAIDSSNDYDHWHFSSAHGDIIITNENDFEIMLNMEYLTTYAQEQKVETKVNEILASIIKEGMSPDYKAKVIHDWIVKNVRYDQTLEEHSAYAGFFKGTTVCQGYSTMLYKMLEEVGIENHILANEEHGWNLVNLGGQLYHLDATWDDPLPDRGDKVSYDYFYLTNDQLKANDKNSLHTYDTKKYPLATDKPYDLKHFLALVNDVEQLDWSDITNQPLDGITSSLDLPTKGANGATITWNSNNPALANNGVVSRPTQGDAEGDLIATLTLDDFVEQKYFKTKVKGIEASSGESSKELLVNSTNPENKAEDISFDRPIIKVDFSEEVAKGPLFKKIILKYGRYTVRSSNSVSGNTLTLKPLVKLKPATTYTVFIPKNSVIGINNSTLVNDYSFTFTTTKKLPVRTIRIESVKTSSTEQSVPIKVIAVLTDKTEMDVTDRCEISFNQKGIVYDNGTLSFSSDIKPNTLITITAKFNGKYTRYKLRIE